MAHKKLKEGFGNVGPERKAAAGNHIKASGKWHPKNPGTVDWSKFLEGLKFPRTRQAIRFEPDGVGPHCALG